MHSSLPSPAFFSFPAHSDLMEERKGRGRGEDGPHEGGRMGGGRLADPISSLLSPRCASGPQCVVVVVVVVVVPRWGEGNRAD